MRARVWLVIAAAAAAAGVAGAGAASARGVREIKVQDRCDPATFDAVLGAGTCVPTSRGTVEFDEFIEELNPHDFGHGAWRFNSDSIGVRPGETIRLPNSGGEFHTFTEVAAFGGGCIPDLNVPLGLSPVPECIPEAAPGLPLAFVTTGIAPGQTITISAPHDHGTHLYMCLLHPWMRAEVEVRD